MTGRRREKEVETTGEGRNKGKKYRILPNKPLQSHLNPGNTKPPFIKVRGENNDENSPEGPGACRALN